MRLTWRQPPRIFQRLHGLKKVWHVLVPFDDFVCRRKALPRAVFLALYHHLVQVYQQLQLVSRHSSTGQKLVERDCVTQNRGLR